MKMKRGGKRPRHGSGEVLSGCRETKRRWNGSVPVFRVLNAERQSGGPTKDGKINDMGTKNAANVRRAARPREYDEVNANDVCWLLWRKLRQESTAMIVDR